MVTRFKQIVIGRGMMGAAAAKYLARSTDGVAVIGPDEPVDQRNHQGVFASHYDEARITRTIDPDAVWALMANRSIARYGAIEAESGIRFYHEAGCLMVGPKRGGKDPYIGNILCAAETLGVSVEVRDGQGLVAGFPYFAFEGVPEGVHESRNAGYVNPRALVKAQAALAEKAGAAIIRQTAVSVRQDAHGVVVTTDTGEDYAADRILVAAGGFSINPALTPRPIDLKVYARTVAFFEIPEERLADYAGMPSLIHQPDNPLDHIYLLPPVRYPDGKVYLKIGGDPDDVVLSTEPDIRTWFRSGGRDSTRRHLKRIVDGLIPSLAQTEATMAGCVVSYTPGGYPAIGFAEGGRIGVVTGGCGAAAKSSDEIGRLGAELLSKGVIEDAGYAAGQFTPAFV